MISFYKLRKPIAKLPIPAPLVPDDGLYVCDFGILFNSKLLATPSGIIKKFTRSFTKVWMQVPEQDRQTLRGCWGPKQPPMPGMPSSPVIALTFPLGCYMAACKKLGFELLFDAWWVDRITPALLSNIIAHELGHAISCSHQWYEQHECAAIDGNECVACECRAFSYMAAWGFDPFYASLPKRKSLAERLPLKFGVKGFGA
jgi:hypothetical protein